MLNPTVNDIHTNIIFESFPYWRFYVKARVVSAFGGCMWAVLVFLLCTKSQLGFIPTVVIFAFGAYIYLGSIVLMQFMPGSCIGDPLLSEEKARSLMPLPLTVSDALAFVELFLTCGAGAVSRDALDIPSLCCALSICSILIAVTRLIIIMKYIWYVRKIGKRDANTNHEYYFLLPTTYPTMEGEIIATATALTCKEAVSSQALEDELHIWKRYPNFIIYVGTVLTAKGADGPLDKLLGKLPS